MHQSKGAFVALVASISMCSYAAPTAEEPPREQFGKLLFIEYELPAKKIAEFAAFKPSAKDEYQSALENVLLAKTEDWISPELMVSSTANPHTIVVRAVGRAREAGRVSAMWQAGWQLGDGEIRASAMPTLRTGDAKPGAQVELIGTSATSFTENRTVAVALGFVSATNFDIEQVKVEVWTGVVDPSWTESILSAPGALVAFAMFGLVWWFRRR